MQALLGKTGRYCLKRRIQTHDINDLNKDWVDQANDLIKNVDLTEVEKLSEGAAIFYSWCTITMSVILDDEAGTEAQSLK